MTLSIALADRASAQSPAASVYYKAYPSDLVSITADNQISVLQQPSAGMMVATVVGTSFILSNGEYIVNPGLLPGQRLFTLRFLTQCSLADGCDGFGLEDLATQQARLLAFQAMDITTMRQFAASGADLNENTANNAAGGFLLYALANIRIDGGLADNEAHPRVAHMSVLIANGANVNIIGTGAAGETMLHTAAKSSSSRFFQVRALLAMPGISVNVVDDSGRTPLDEIAALASFIIGDVNRQKATLIYNAGGRCQLPLAISRHPGLCNQ